MQTGLQALLTEHLGRLHGKRVGLCCNHTAVDHQLLHAIDALIDGGVKLIRLFGPEHGVRATAQDMEGVDETVDPVTGIETVSLYGNTEASLHPSPHTLEDLDIILFDIQDIGARYYTYQATLGYLMEVAGQVNTAVWVLDRPNPINGVCVEGNVVQPGFESFVSAYPLAVRHGMTMGELARYFQQFCHIDCEVEVIPCAGWKRSQWFDQTDLPWLYPSPNMPTLETATIYPGMCLVEGTNLSEGRGTTRPFHLVGAPWLDPRKMARLCEERSQEVGLNGVRFRPAAFLPRFQKHALKNCAGIEIHLCDRNRLNATLLGVVVLAAAHEANPSAFAWRTETYEFVDDPIAIDLLWGSTALRNTIDSGGSLNDLWQQAEQTRAMFDTQRASVLLYP